MALDTYDGFTAAASDESQIHDDAAFDETQNDLGTAIAEASPAIRKLRKKQPESGKRNG